MTSLEKRLRLGDTAPMRLGDRDYLNLLLRALPERTRSGSRRGAGQSHQFHNHPAIKIAGYVK